MTIIRNKTMEMGQIILVFSSVLSITRKYMKEVAVSKGELFRKLSTIIPLNNELRNHTI